MQGCFPHQLPHLSGRGVAMAGIQCRRPGIGRAIPAGRWLHAVEFRPFKRSIWIGWALARGACFVWASRVRRMGRGWRLPSHVPLWPSLPGLLAVPSPAPRGDGGPEFWPLGALHSPCWSAFLAGRGMHWCKWGSVARRSPCGLLSCLFCLFGVRGLIAVSRSWLHAALLC